MYLQYVVSLGCAMLFVAAPQFIGTSADLPQDAQLLVEASQKSAAAVERRAAQEQQKLHDELKGQLEKLQLEYTKAGKLDEAVAIRDYLRAGLSVSHLKPLPDPGNLSAHRLEAGRMLLFDVQASAGKSIFGTEIYTHDSHLATAAVHAGVLKSGERGLVKVTILPAQDRFPGSGRNGVVSSSWSASSECFRIELVKLTGPASSAGVRQDPGNLTGYRDQVGQSVEFAVIGANEPGIYGSDIYSDDSPLSVAAVHAGLLQPEEKGVVKVTILGPQEKFESSARNGVTSRGWSNYAGSYRVDAVGQ